MRLHPLQNCSQTGFCSQHRVHKSRTFKEVVQRIQQADGRGKQLISHVIFTEYFSNFGRAAPDFAHLLQA